MMPGPTARSNRQVCNVPRSCATPRGVLQPPRVLQVRDQAEPWPIRRTCCAARRFALLNKPAFLAFSLFPRTAREDQRSDGRKEMEEETMTRITMLAALVGLLFAASSTADARGGGASAFAPGQQFRAHGSIAGHPGASGYAPGRLMKAHGSLRGHPGASGYAPGHRFIHH
jgi:hypothetical protein